MSSKKPTIQELEIKLANSKVTKVRMDILNDLCRNYHSGVEKKYCDQIQKQGKIRDNYKVPDQKADVEKIVAAIQKVIGTKYVLVNTVVCKIAHGNNLTFDLAPNLDHVPEVRDACKKHADLLKQKEHEERRIAEWKRRQMYNIANGKDFEEFKE